MSLALAEAHDRRFMVRLVKGAYWDSEIKRAQERGLADYPVFTRKAMTDLNYDACAVALLAAPRLFPQFATHNARSVAAVLTMRAGARARLRVSAPARHGRAAVRGAAPKSATPPCASMRRSVRIAICSPISCGGLIENGANSSFVARAADPETPESALIVDPHDVIGDAKSRAPSAPAAADARSICRCAPIRKAWNLATGTALGGAARRDRARRAARQTRARAFASAKAARRLLSPIDAALGIGAVVEADEAAARGRWRSPRAPSRTGTRRQSKRARGCWNARPISSRRGAAR